MTMNKTKRLNVTVVCFAVYNSGIDVPYEMSLDEAIQYAKNRIDEIPISELEYISDTDEIDEENCYFETDLD